MSGAEDALHAHLQTGVTTVARAWLLERRDGVNFGFTDHDLPLSFDGQTFDANGGLTARALLQTSGLAIDNTEALGALSDARITEADINAGRYDGAVVTAWLVNWQDVSARKILFKGSIGEIRRGDGAFEAELRGLTEMLNQPQGRVYGHDCSAILGDAACGVDVLAPGYSTERPLEVISERKVFGFAELAGFDAAWFERGRFVVVSGAAAGLVGLIKHDRETDAGREIELWQALRAPLEPGDIVRLEVGCDKRSETCAAKFLNIANFQGFPHIPGDDWLTAIPRTNGRNTGGALV
ncbi:MAG: DUF2163 domain-containing protein [Pseudomonadota bacterium]